MNDYARFAQTLYQNGTFGGTRIIGRKTLRVDDLRSSRARMSASAPLPCCSRDIRFGLGFAVRREVRHGPDPRHAGKFFWGGVAGTYFWVAPKEELYAVMMVQAPRQRDYFRQLFRTLVYAALA